MKIKNVINYSFNIVFLFILKFYSDKYNRYRMGINIFTRGEGIHKDETTKNNITKKFLQFIFILLNNKNNNKIDNTIHPNLIIV